MLNKRVRRHLGEHPDSLCSRITETYGLDVESFPDHVTSRFGQRLELKQADGHWKSDLHVEHIGYGVKMVRWSAMVNENILIEWAFRLWFIERLELRIDLRPATAIATELPNLLINESESESEHAVFEWACALSTRALLKGQPDLATGVRLFYAWCVDEDLPYFCETKLDILNRMPLPRSGAEHLVSLLDPVGGPYSYTELREIEKYLNDNPGLVRGRAIYHLCRDWGLRPIQLALLRATDLGCDEIGPFILAPSVKGIRRSGLRRNVTNFRKRHISAEANESVEALIQHNIGHCNDLRAELVKHNLVSLQAADSLPQPLFPGGRSKARLTRFLSDPAISDYVLHSDAIRISREFRELTGKLCIPRIRGAGESLRDEQGDLLLEIGCYRLRRTMGTSMVMNGASPDEVADALDHETVNTVSHYFKLNGDLIDYVNEAHSSSEVMKAAVQMWSGQLMTRNEALTRNLYTINNLGVCKRDSVCPHHPTISCYACPKFRPFLEGDHEAARDAIKIFRDEIEDTSTGPVRRQLDEAFRGAGAVIQAVADARKI